jgi:hypothetical protein
VWHPPNPRLSPIFLPPLPTSQPTKCKYPHVKRKKIAKHKKAIIFHFLVKEWVDDAKYFLKKNKRKIKKGKEDYMAHLTMLIWRDNRKEMELRKWKSAADAKGKQMYF